VQTTLSTPRRLSANGNRFPRAIRRPGLSASTRRSLPPFYPNRCGDGFLSRFTLDGELIYSTLIGGIGSDLVNTIIADDQGRATVTGLMQGFPAKLTDIYWAGPLLRSSPFLARLSPDGTAANFFTDFPLNGLGPPLPPIPMPDGALGFLRVEQRTDPAGKWDAGPTMFIVKELPPTLPRIDRVTITGRLEDGYALEILGIGFGDRPEVILDGKVLPWISPPGNTPLKTSVFQIFPSADETLREADVAHYRLTIRNTDDGSESAPVQVTLTYRKF
jgi:hypothetical protein